MQVSLPDERLARRRARAVGERVIELLLFFAALVSVFTTVGIVYILVKESVVFFAEVPIARFLTDTQWTPLFDDAHFGIVVLLSGTLTSSAVALLIAIPLGTMHAWVVEVATAAGDPNHLLYAVAGYNNSVQEVLARVRVLNFGTADGPRGGVATCVDPAASPAGRSRLGGAGAADASDPVRLVPWIAWSRWCSRRQPSQPWRWVRVSAFSSGVSVPEIKPLSLDLTVAQSTSVRPPGPRRRASRTLRQGVRVRTVYRYVARGT